MADSTTPLQRERRGADGLERARVPIASADGADPSRRPWPVALAVSLRPAQWVKNGALLVAPFFGRQLVVPTRLEAVALGIVAFCALASAVYLVNDLVDAPRDRLHPAKRRRPIASRELGPGAAVGGGLALAVVGLSLSAAVGPGFLLAALAYVGVQVLYMAALKRVVILDVFAVASGFVLRVVAGAEAAQVPVSNWLYLFTLLASLFVALGKRRAELVALGPDAGRHRTILDEYPAAFVEQLLTVLSACTLLSYALYTVSPDTIQRFGSDRLKFTVPFVVFGLARYLYLMHRHGAGGEPENVLLHDRPSQTNVAGFLAIAAWAIYG